MEPNVEIIQIRSGSHQSRTLNSIIQETVRTIQQEYDEGTIKFYVNGLISGDYMICLFWDGPVAEKQGSAIGRKLKTELAAHGLINHSLWIEQEARDE